MTSVTVDLDTRSWRALWVAAATAARRATQDRGGLVVMVAFYAFVVGVVGSLWRTAALAHHGTIVGYTGSALFWYIAASEATTVSINIRLIEDVGNEIGDGSFAAELLRPISAVAVRLASECGRVAPRLGICAIAGTLLSWAVVGSPLSWGATAWAIPSMMLAVGCNLAAQYAFAGAAFWLRNAQSSWFLYQKFVFIIGGMLLPLEVLPKAMQVVGWCLPFSAMAYIPGRIAAGRFEFWLLAVQVAWLCAMVALAAIVFRAGERRVQVTGG